MPFARIDEGLRHAILAAEVRTALDIRDDLMRSLLARHPGVSKRRAVERAIEAYRAQDAAAGARALAGRGQVDDVYSQLRRRDRRT